MKVVNIAQKTHVVKGLIAVKHKEICAPTKWISSLRQVAYFFKTVKTNQKRKDR